MGCLMNVKEWREVHQLNEVDGRARGRVGLTRTPPPNPWSPEALGVGAGGLPEALVVWSRWRVNRVNPG